MEHAKLAKAKLAKATGLAQRSTEACRVCVCLAACGHVPEQKKPAMSTKECEEKGAEKIKVT